MRLVVARRSGRRGEGLGNELLSWSKGFLASQVLDAKLVGPSWGINSRRYYRNFGTSRFDFMVEDLLYCLPHHRFTEKDYWETGEMEFSNAVAKWAESRGLLGKSNFVVSVSGMYGGYPAISRARPFLWNQLLSSRNALRNIYELQSRLDPSKLFVAVHLRLGSDFSDVAAGDSGRGKFNVFIPASWYFDACEALKQAFGNRVQFHIFTDKPGEAYWEAVARFNPGQVMQSGLTETSDLLLMSLADLRVCSVSSYSLAACFLSGGPYLWYEPQLGLQCDLYSLWGHEPQQQLPDSMTQRAVRYYQETRSEPFTWSSVKGWPYRGPGPLPGGLLQNLEHRLAEKQPYGDLLSYGVVSPQVAQDTV